jgi:hypothetical protein
MKYDKEERIFLLEDMEVIALRDAPRQRWPQDQADALLELALNARAKVLEIDTTSPFHAERNAAISHQIALGRILTNLINELIPFVAENSHSVASGIAEIEAFLREQ